MKCSQCKVEMRLIIDSSEQAVMVCPICGEIEPYHSDEFVDDYTSWCNEK